MIAELTIPPFTKSTTVMMETAGLPTTATATQSISKVSHSTFIHEVQTESTSPKHVEETTTELTPPKPEEATKSSDSSTKSWNNDDHFIAHQLENTTLINYKLEEEEHDAGYDAVDLRDKSSNKTIAPEMIVTSPAKAFHTAEQADEDRPYHNKSLVIGLSVFASIAVLLIIGTAVIIKFCRCR